MATTSAADLQTLQVLNEAFETQTPQDVLAYAIGAYFPDIVLASSFGVEDVVLIDMVHRKPATLSEMAEVHGVGEAKLARYGQEFLAVIRQYQEGA